MNTFTLPPSCDHRRNGLGPFRHCSGSDCIGAIRAGRKRPYRLYGEDGLPITAMTMHIHGNDYGEV